MVFELELAVGLSGREHAVDASAVVGQCDVASLVVRQELASELGIVISLRTVERAVSHLRRKLAAEALATVRFETPPGRQLQIDFGQRRVAIEGEDPGRVFLFVATLGYSRRLYARAFRHERQSAWLEGIEGAFRHFGGLPGELLLDNARALVKHHGPVTREVEFTDRLHAFACYWDVRPVACARYRARTTDEIEQPLSGLPCYFPDTHGRPRSTERGVRYEPCRAAIMVVPRLRRPWVFGGRVWSSPQPAFGRRSRPARHAASPPAGS